MPPSSVTLQDLPVEVLSHIFALASAPPRGGISVEQEIPISVLQSITLSHVNARLRQVALSTPNLWAYLHELMPNSAIDAFIERSGTLPIMIRIQEFLIKDPIKVDKLYSCIERWEVVFFALDHTPGYGVLPVEKFRLPVLKELIACGADDNMEEKIEGWAMPELSILHLYCNPPHFTFPSTITVFHYHHASYDEADVMEQEGYDFLRSLGALVNLQYLSIDSDLSDPCVPIEFKTGVQELPRLLSLQIRFENADDPFCSIPFKLRAPRLRKLGLAVGGHEYMQSLLRHFDHHKKFDFIRITYPPFKFFRAKNLHIPSIFGSLPDTRDLVISAISLEREESLEGQIAPISLESLTFENVQIEGPFLSALLQEMRGWDSWKTFKTLRVTESYVYDETQDKVRREADGKLSWGFCFPEYSWDVEFFNKHHWYRDLDDQT